MESIGYVEVIGLADAIIVGDHMLKAASVGIKNIENATGGLITVSVSGDVAAVEAAIEAGTADSRVHVVSTVVLANPAEGITELGRTNVFTDEPAAKEPAEATQSKPKAATTQKAERQPATRESQVPTVQAKQTAPVKAKPEVKVKPETKATPTAKAKPETKATPTAKAKPAAKKPASRRRSSRKPTNRAATPKPKPTDKPES
ncbi:BMC domain-containing protein [Levilactobacillus cerevisiae]|uniref:BMC domain-containing protein n=1 Tax=Levilactobacillus cerevisiae TaxID=1704076 RepID=UPI000F7A7582|nr:BMC domain-containing protein [Levilactobacillus cerevisiae]